MKEDQGGATLLNESSALGWRKKMPVNKKMMKAMKKEYGDKKGESVYYAMEEKRKKHGMKIGAEKHTKRRGR